MPDLPAKPEIKFGIFDVYHRPISETQPPTGPLKVGYRIIPSYGSFGGSVWPHKDEAQERLAGQINRWRNALASARRSSLTFEHLVLNRPLMRIEPTGQWNSVAFVFQSGLSVTLTPARYAYTNDITVTGVPAGPFTVERVLKTGKTLITTNGERIELSRKLSMRHAYLNNDQIRELFPDD